MKRGIFLAIVSGILLSLPFSYGNLWILAWVGFVPLFFALENRPQAQSFLLFYISGIIFWVATAYWLVHVTLPGAIVLVLYLALYFGLFGLVIRPCTRRYGLFTLIFIPAAWVVLEYVRGHLFSGFPWALLGYSQYLNLPAIQIADITGAWGVSFLVVFVNAAIVEIIWAKKTGHSLRLRSVSIILALILTLVLSYGFYKLDPRPTSDIPRKLRVSVIQGNIPQKFKWDPAYNGFIMGRYITLSAQAAQDLPDLIVWPEAAFPVIPEEEPSYYKRAQDFTASFGIPLLLGAVTQRQGFYYNSALLVRGRQEPSIIYDKVHLVPFGEYIPLKNALPFLSTIVPIGDITKGDEPMVFSIRPPRLGQPVKFSVLICFEDIFPGLSRAFARRGAEFLVNITNDAWYKVSSAPYQHLQASVLRCVENRLYLARSANTGISCFIAPTGRVISVVGDEDSGREIFVTGYKTQEIDIAKSGFSFYCLFGDWFVLLCALIIFFCLLRACAAAYPPPAPYAPPRQ